MQNYTEKKVTILCGSIGRRAGVILLAIRCLLRLFPTVLGTGTARFGISGLSMDRTGRSPRAGYTFAENAICDSGNMIISNERTATWLSAHF